jgi:hypothetical protein
MGFHHHGAYLSIVADDGKQRSTTAYWSDLVLLTGLEKTLSKFADPPEQQRNWCCRIKGALK